MKWWDEWIDVVVPHFLLFMSTQYNDNPLFCPGMLILASKFARDLKWIGWPHRSFLSPNFLVQQVIERNQSLPDWRFWQLLFSGCQWVICYSPCQLKSEQRHMLCQSHSSDLPPSAQFSHFWPFALLPPFLSVKCLYILSNSEAPLPPARSWIRAHLLWVLLQPRLQLCKRIGHHKCKAVQIINASFLYA